MERIHVKCSGGLVRVLEADNFGQNVYRDRRNIIYLHKTTHHSIAEEEFVSSCRESWDYGVVWSFSSLGWLI